MNPKQTFFLVLIVAAATGGGFWLGERHSRSKQAATSESTSAQTTSSAGNPGRLPPVKSRLASAARSSDSGEASFSLAEIESKLLALRDSDRRRGREYQKLLDAINPADIPHLL